MSSKKNNESLFPIEIIASTSGSLADRYSGHSRIIYNAIVITVLLGLGSLPFISIDVSIKANALIRPSSEISAVQSLVNGRVKESFVSENRHVRKGDVLYIVESDIAVEKEKYLLSKISEAKYFIDDLKALSEAYSFDEELFKKISTSLYQQSLASFQQKLNESTTHYNKTLHDYDRNKKLHDEKVIADSEFENYVFELEKAKHEIEILRQTQLSLWQTDLNNYNKDLHEYETQRTQLQKESENLVIKAPVSGTVQSHLGIYSGNVVFANQDLLQISPDTNLIVEVYVSPNDIGLLQHKMKVRFQINAFNYNQWGLASGSIVELPNDIQMIDDQPMFKVKCSLDKDHLTLKNGYKGFLKKGMTLQARFIVTERTLWQLLYDRIDNWMNPNISTASL
ncbi:HlyD family secretion protein [Ohtaekwangia koreensis]|uniref:HlyD family secretion protein n=1 Tax=Ohtaekwangia koreensis TaxID=688867 RepID=A0A1T5ITY4_9BACT|nr:HlyD family efflux transporter periplasmic adaptor subunit [Ohtaekwangia koreensis]SKC42616.1 HlyD family secretion protein [Ohtaekwangia koreensis]